jgi:hypothetical protein
VVVARFMADNIRSGQRIADGLLAWVDLALDQVRIVEQNASSTGMFGEEPTLPRQQLFERLGKNGNTATAIEEPAAQRGGAVAAGEGAERREAEPAGDGRGAEDGAGGRGAEGTGQDESGIAQDLLGDKPNTSQQQAADERARRAGQDQQRRNAAPAPEEFALGMEDARTGSEVDPNQQELLGGVEQAAPADDFTADIAQAERDLADLQTQHQAARGKKREELTGRIDRLQKEVELLRQVDKAVDDEGRQRFTVSIPLLGDVPYRASKPVDADGGEVVSSRVITTKTKLTKAQAQSLGLPADKGQVFAWRVSVVRGDGGVYSAIEVMAQDHGRSPDGEVLAHFKPVDTPEAVERVAPAVMKAAAADLQAAQDADADTLPGFSRKPSAPWRMEAGDEVVIADINRAIAPSGAQVTAVASFDELPQLVKEKAKAHGVGPKEMRGITLGGGRVFVVHGNHSSLADVQATIVHEVYGHVGLRALFGPDIYRRLNKLYLSLGDSKVRALAEKYGVDAAYFDMANQLKASPAVVRRAGGATELRNGWLAEELLAHIAERETGTLRQQARELVGAIRAWLREHGFMQLSDLGMTDIAHILKQGRLALETQSDFGGVDAPPVFSRSASTKAAYEARIDALFAGGKPTLDGVRVLDRSDMLALLGMGDGPVNLAEGKVTAGQDNHPHMTAAMWKKIPQWLDNPALVFDSDTTPGRLVFIAPELVNGAPVRIIVEPNAAGSINAHLLVNAYDAERNPFQRWEREGLLRYFDQQKAPSISGTFQPRLTGLPGNKRRGKILTLAPLSPPSPTPSAKPTAMCCLGCRPMGW